MPRSRKKAGPVPVALAAIGLFLALGAHFLVAPGPSVGQRAPEIKGTLQDGTSARLSDYRKKVVFLDFWGDW